MEYSSYPEIGGKPNDRELTFLKQEIRLNLQNRLDMKVLSKIFLLFFLQSLLEIIFMTLLDKLGVYYMYDSKRALLMEDLSYNGLIVIYKMAYFIVPYVCLMLIGNRVAKRLKPLYSRLAISHVVVNAMLVFAFGLYFRIDVKMLINPLLATGFASLVVYAVGRRRRSWIFNQ